MIRGDAVIYMTLAGERCRARVVAVRSEGPKYPSAANISGTMADFPGSLDIAVDAGSTDPVQLTRIELVEEWALHGGTCMRVPDGGKD